MQYLARFFCCLLLLIAMPSLAAPPSRVQAQYDLLQSGLKVAVMHETFIRSQNQYRIESVTRPYGLLALLKHETIRITSTGTVTAQGLRPQTFDYRLEHDTERNAHASFDWSAGKITLTDRSGTRSLPLPSGTQDRLSAMYQFMFLPLAKSTELKFDMTNGSKVDDYHYLITPDRHATVPLGSFQTLYLASPPSPNGRRTEIWLAKKFSHLPCKMVITKGDGDKLTQALTQLNFVP